MGTSDTEKAAKLELEQVHTAGELYANERTHEKPQARLDHHGFALVPQPTQFRDDPLNWPSWMKWMVLVQVSVLALLGPFNSSVVNPALVVLAKHFHISSQQASYQTTTAIITAGVFPILWTPLANVYGRRPVYLLTTLIGVVASVGSGVAASWAALVATRAIAGGTTCAAMALGAATVNDMFFLHERGAKMGVWTVFLQSMLLVVSPAWFPLTMQDGAHIAPLIGGYLTEGAGYRWDYYLPAVTNAVLLVIMVFALPETLFSRSDENLRGHRERTYFQMLFSFRRNCLRDRSLHWRDFARPFEMLRYPSVSLTWFYYTVSFAYGTVLPAVTVAILFTKTYHFETGVIGLMLGLPLLIGSFLGEILSGPFSDLIMYEYAKRHDGERKPEARLPASWASAFFLPAGIIIYGVCLHLKTHWIGPVIGNAVAGFGLQLATTVNYAYCSDCYKPQSGEIGTLYNFGRQIFSFTVGFYAIPFASRVGVQWAWLTLALIVLFTFSGVVVLMFKGETWRKKLGRPTFHEDI